MIIGTISSRRAVKLLMLIKSKRFYSFLFDKNI